MTSILKKKQVSFSEAHLFKIQKPPLCHQDKVLDASDDPGASWWDPLATPHLHPLSYLTVHLGLIQSCMTLCDLMGCSLPGSPVHGILQARVLKWVAISFSRGSS